MTVKIALYARFSCDLQNPLSADDQLDMCHRFALRRWPESQTIVPFKDDSASGKSMETRKGLHNMLNIVRSRHWIVVTESLDRISRNLEDTIKVYNTLLSRHIRLITVDHGEIDYLQMGIRGTISAVFIKDMVKKVRRGQKAKAKRGLFPAGLSYGYRVVRDATDQQDRPINGQRAIKDSQAKIVQRIFNERDSGLTQHTIANRLNNEGIPTSRGGIWRASTIHDILRNDLYRGELVYNRTTFSPDIRCYIENPPSEWIRAHRPDLQIIDSDLWYRVQKKRVIPKTPSKGPLPKDRKPRGLAHIVHCGVCGSRCIISDNNRLMCANAKIRECKNYRRIKETDTLLFILQQSRMHMMDIKDWQREIEGYHATETKEIQEARKNLDDLEKKIDRWTKAIENGVDTSIAIQRLNQLQDNMPQARQKAALQRMITLKHPPHILAQKGLKEISRAVDNIELRYLARDILPIFVDKVLSTPIASQREGSQLSITFKENQLPRFLQTAQELWFSS